MDDFIKKTIWILLSILIISCTACQPMLPISSSVTTPPTTFATEFLDKKLTDELNDMQAEILNLHEQVDSLTDQLDKAILENKSLLSKQKELTVSYDVLSVHSWDVQLDEQKQKTSQICDIYQHMLENEKTPKVTGYIRSMEMTGDEKFKLSIQKAVWVEDKTKDNGYRIDMTEKWATCTATTQTRVMPLDTTHGSVCTIEQFYKDYQEGNQWYKESFFTLYIRGGRILLIVQHYQP